MAEPGQKYKMDIDINNCNDTRVMEMSYIGPNAFVLDVGCACGDFGKILSSYKNATMYGLEYNPDSCKIALDTGAYTEVKQCDLDSLTDDSFPEYKSKFDYIVCGDVLEHLRNPKETLRILKTFLKEGGHIVASIPNIAHTSIKANLLMDDFTYTDLGLLDETHIHLFTHKSIAEMLSKTGLLIKECKFSFLPKQGWQPDNPYSKIPGLIQIFIFQDWHSFVCQYIMKISVSNEDEQVLFEKNISALNINENNAPAQFKDYRLKVLSELKTDN